MRMTKFWRLSVSQNNIGSGDMMKPLVIPRYFWRATAEKNYHLLASVPLHFSPCCAPDNHYLLLPNRSLPSPSSSSTPGLPETVNPRPHPQTPSSPVFCERLLSWFSCELLAKVFFVVVRITSSLPSPYLNANAPQSSSDPVWLLLGSLLWETHHPNNTITNYSFIFGCSGSLLLCWGFL